ncbi:phosphate ABC transporter permease [Gemmatimonas phototrophica]|uniref:Phosphate transport system permease protein PstA n=1 Tax=Gemmatimonas phototrophica TaxID=1379270 RepID=A0A143BPB6_9BACT|nr:phosphate ABC transporter permease [Gemmatimonas phototrophica]
MLVQRVATVALWSATLLTLALLVLIIVFVMQRGLSQVTWDFLSQAPSRSGAEGGIWPMIVGTLYVTAAGVLLATPIGLGAAIYLAEYTAEGRVSRIIRSGTESLAGVPSIIFGLFGFAFFVTTLGLGWSILSGGLTLGAMILPTIIRTAEEALRAVPREFRHVAQSLGASKWDAIRTVVLPVAAPGVATGVVLGVGRAISETAAVIFTAGVALEMPTSLFSSTRTMSVHFYTLTMEGISDEKAYGTAAVLVVTILLLNIMAYSLMHRMTRRYR